MSLEIELVNKTISIVAKRGSGKSVLAKHFIEHHRDKFEKIFCICPTESINHHYQKDGLIPQNCIRDEWNEDWAVQLTKNLQKINANKPQKEMKMVLLILDDLYNDTDTHHSKILKSIFTRSRHYGLAVISLTQTLYSLPPFARINQTYTELVLRL